MPSSSQAKTFRSVSLPWAIRADSILPKVMPRKKADNTVLMATLVEPMLSISRRTQTTWYMSAAHPEGTSSQGAPFSGNTVAGWSDCEALDVNINMGSARCY